MVDYPTLMTSCQSCLFWKKDWGIWAHNRWTRELSTKGTCTRVSMTPPLDMDATAIPCHQYSAKVDQCDLFWPPNGSRPGALVKSETRELQTDSHQETGCEVLEYAVVHVAKTP